MTALHYAVLCDEPRAMILKLLESQGHKEGLGNDMSEEIIARKIRERQRRQSSLPRAKAIAADKSLSFGPDKEGSG